MSGSPAPTIAIVSAGVMGAAIAKRLTTAGCTVLTDLAGRSESTRRRAEDAGMQDARLSDIAHEADWVLSILPPGEAEQFSLKFLQAYEADVNIARDIHSYKSSRRSRPPVFVDCNAKNPQSAKHLAAPFLTSPVVFIDASIVGLPPTDSHDPTFYASAEPGDASSLTEFGNLSYFGLVVKLLEGEGTGVGDASALKMAFSGIMKGMIATHISMIWSAHSHSPATAQALLRQLQISKPNDIKNIAFYVPLCFSKAYRFVREMEEMAGFVADRVDGHGTEVGVEGSGISQTYEGFAQVYQRLANSVDGSGDKDDVDILRAFAEDAGKAPDDS